MSDKQGIMETSVKEFWNKRFAAPGYMYGKEPNAFFKSMIDVLMPGKIFIPGAGEGRDAVYAAKKGWDVYCADISEMGKVKAMKLAEENEVSIRYDITDINKVSYPEGQFDVVAAIFFHLPAAERNNFFENTVKWLAPGGVFIAELFTPDQLNYGSGGPKDKDLLVTAVELADAMGALEVIRNTEREVTLSEGTHHQGKASVVRFIGVRNEEI